MNPAPAAPSYMIHGPADPTSPIILSVPHAGRDYPDALIQALRVPLSALMALEDPHVDAIAQSARAGETLIVATRARAWIDLNRSEQDRDPAVEDGSIGQRIAIRSAKVRGGLGLVPRRAASAAELWSRRFTSREIDQRIAIDHRPYHAELARLIAAARSRFGVAVLLDLHSMPPLGDGDRSAQIVIGDRFGKSSGARMVDRLAAEVEAAGLRVAVNTPYPGGHILDRHGDPAKGVHAIQIEIDRSLYLDAALRLPGPGAGRISALIRAMIDAVADDLLPVSLAAE